MILLRAAVAILVVLHCTTSAPAEVAGAPSRDELLVADSFGNSPTIVISQDAGKSAQAAAADLGLFIEKMTGAKPVLANTASAVEKALVDSKTAILIIGEEALRLEPSLRKRLAQAAKPNPVLRADAIVVRRQGNRVFLAGNHDDAHYYAVSWLLQQWGCRWYLPTAFGECIPRHDRLTAGKLDFAYGSPFEARQYWLAWNASTEGQSEFQKRNFGNNTHVPSGHNLATYTKELIPKGKSAFNVPIAEPSTAEHVARQVAPLFAKGQNIMLGLEDGVYESDSPKDRELKAGLWDKYFLTPSMSDAFMAFYNNVSRTLLNQYPDSPSKIGFLAYANITLPPQRKTVAEKPLVAYLAAIDIDPIHGMDDPKSPPRQEYREMMYRWSEAMQGRLVIYDYDQSMLVWRDLPNPSIRAFQQDVQHYRKAGILGIATETRGAMATTFLNFFFRLQLAWNPDARVDALLAEFYPKFYGPAAKPMEAYWSSIMDAWSRSIVTEHEHFVAPAIYTPALLRQLKGNLLEAEQLAKSASVSPKASPDPLLLTQRLQFTRLGFSVLENYMAMVQAAASDGDYRKAVAAGEQGLKARLELARLHPTFTTRVVGVAAEDEKNGPAWWPGEVQQYRALLALTDGTKGTLLQKTPVEWAFRRDPHDTGLPSGWASGKTDLSWWANQKNKEGYQVHQNNPGEWEMLRTDLYPQAQGVISPDFHSYTGYAWYRTQLDIGSRQASGKVHLMFPGLFNECWLYLNGFLVAHRAQKAIWWENDYAFEWDVDLSKQLQPGKNTLALRISNPHHFGGIFRRPFLYKPAGEAE
ncbi:MAG TPA: DUF4838 domain-containing protein [Candidatus Saccharimonadales bacterium]|nr:DUF4838 domain-containing protein [Candidatus Saccharimonadales bacterium]